jgi:hypothetical protein
MLLYLIFFQGFPQANPIVRLRDLQGAISTMRMLS